MRMLRYVQFFPFNLNIIKIHILLQKTFITKFPQKKEFSYMRNIDRMSYVSRFKIKLFSIDFNKFFPEETMS